MVVTESLDFVINHRQRGGSGGPNEANGQFILRQGAGFIDAKDRRRAKVLN